MELVLEALAMHLRDRSVATIICFCEAVGKVLGGWKLTQKSKEIYIYIYILAYLFTNKTLFAYALTM